MDVTNQVANQMMDKIIVRNSTRSSQSKPKDDQSSGFDQMVRQRRDANSSRDSRDNVRSQDGQRDQTSNQAQDRTDGTDTRAQGQGEPDKAQGQPGNAQGQNDDATVVTVEQYSMAAAIMLQIVPAVEDVVEIAPEIVQDVAAVEQVPDIQIDLDAGPAIDLGPSQMDIHADDVQDTGAFQDLLPEQQVVVNTDLNPQQQVQQGVAEQVVGPEEQVVVDTDLNPQQQVQQGAQVVDNRAQQTQQGPLQRTDVDDDTQVDNVQNDDQDQGLIQQAAAGATQTPVFDNTSATPVRVGQPDEPVVLEAPQAADEIAARIDNYISSDNGDTTMEITLVPPSLGKISVSVTHSQDGSLHVMLSATTTRATQILERNSGSLQNLLGAARPDTHVEVRTSESSQQQFLDPNGNGEQQRRQQQQQQQRQQRHDHEGQDFLQQLRLGLVSLDDI